MTKINTKQTNMNPQTVGALMKLNVFTREKEHREIPRFSKDYRYSYEYVENQLKKGKLNPENSYGKRMIRNALEHPHWTLDDWRGHGKPTGKSFRFFDEQGNFVEGIQFKNRQEESKYSHYLNAIGKYLSTGDDSELKKFKGKSVIDKNGTKHRLVTKTEKVNKLARFGELPSGEDIYIS